MEMSKVRTHETSRTDRTSITNITELIKKATRNQTLIEPEINDHDYNDPTAYTPAYTPMDSEKRTPGIKRTFSLMERDLAEGGNLFPDLRALYVENIPFYFGFGFMILLVVGFAFLDQILDEHKTMRNDGKPRGFLHRLSADDMHVFKNLVFVGICISTGLLAEMFIGTRILQWMNQNQLWTWFYAQLAFAFLVMVGFGTKDLSGLPFGVIGLYKFGFPETIGYFHSFKDRFKQGDWQCLISLCNGLGTLLHHSCALYAMISVSLGYCPRTSSTLVCILPIILQHSIVVFKFFHANLYLFMALSLEAWWEWEMFINIPYLKPHSIRFMARGMLVAHWLYLTAALLGLFASDLDEEEDTVDIQTFLGNVRTLQQIRKEYQMNRWDSAPTERRMTISLGSNWNRSTARSKSIALTVDNDAMSNSTNMSHTLS